jgi:hypothetical protein
MEFPVLEMDVYFTALIVRYYKSLLASDGKIKLSELLTGVGTMAGVIGY